MERRVVFNQWQKLTTEDAENLGIFPRESLDHAVQDMGPGWAFTGFACVQSAPAVVTVGSGRLYDPDGKVYFSDAAGGVAIDLLANLPGATKRIAAIVAWGQEILTDTEPRTFITDANTRTTEARPTSTESRRHANLQEVLGIEGPDPQKPTVASNVLVVAWVTLNTTGIELIEAEEGNRLQGLAAHNAALITLNAWRAAIGTRIDTLAQELANLAGRIHNLTPLDVFLRLVIDVTRLKEKADLPDSYSDWGSDYFLDEEESQTTHVDYLARIEEGLRFSNAAERIVQLALANPIDNSVVVTDNFVLPAYHEVRRLANVATVRLISKVIKVLDREIGWYWDPRDREYEPYVYFDVDYKRITVATGPTEISISQFAHQTITWRHVHRVRWRVRWGVPYYWSSRINFWWDRRHDPVWWTFHRRFGDPDFILLPFGIPTPYYKWRHVYRRTKWFWWDRVVDRHYWERRVTTTGINGSVLAQTFLNPQAGWLTAVHLFFTRRGVSGDVEVLIVECTDNGQPDKDAVVGRTTLDWDDIMLWPKATRVSFAPIFLDQGKRYAIVPITSGAHYLATTERNQLTSGTLFFSTDQVWFQGLGDMTRDLAFELVFAEFEATRFEVQLAPAELSGGVAALDINTDAQIPEGTELTFEAQINGVWTPLADPGPEATTPPLTGLPPLVNMRAVFTGAPSLMPGMAIGPNSEIYTWRQRSDFKHVSETRTMPGAVNTVTVTLRAESWLDTPAHTLDCKLRTGTEPTFATIINPTATATEVASDDPGAIVRNFTFSSLGGITAYKIEISGTTNNVLTPYHVAERVDIALA
jgi:hypothetical protein